MTSEALGPREPIQPLERTASEPGESKVHAESFWDGIGWLERTLRPNEGWIAAGLLVLNLMVVVISVERADWVPSPNLVRLLFISMEFL